MTGSERTKPIRPPAGGNPKPRKLIKQSQFEDVTISVRLLSETDYGRKTRSGERKTKPIRRLVAAGTRHQIRNPRYVESEETKPILAFGADPENLTGGPHAAGGCRQVRLLAIGGRYAKLLV